MGQKRDPEFRISSKPLKCFRSFFACADVDRIADFIDKYFTVTRRSCFQHPFSDLSHLINRHLADHDFNF